MGDGKRGGRVSRFVVTGALLVTPLAGCGEDEPHEGVETINEPPEPELAVNVPPDEEPEETVEDEPAPEPEAE